MYVLLTYSGSVVLFQRVFLKDQEYNAFILFSCVILLLALHTFHPSLVIHIFLSFFVCCCRVAGFSFYLFFKSTFIRRKIYPSKWNSKKKQTNKLNQTISTILKIFKSSISNIEDVSVHFQFVRHSIRSRLFVVHQKSNNKKKDEEKKNDEKESIDPITHTHRHAHKYTKKNG